MGYNNYRSSNNRCKIKTRAQSKLHRKSKREIPTKIVDPPSPTNLVATDADTPNLNGLEITGIIIGLLIGLTIIIYCLILFMRKRKNSSEDDEEGELPTNPRELNSLTTNISSAPANKNDKDRKSIKSVPVEVSKHTKKSSEENNNECVPQYYNGMEIPPLGTRIISLERQMQIAKELTSPTNNNTSTTNITNNNYYNNSNSSSAVSNM